MVIEFKEKSDNFFAILGGVPYLESIDLIPMIPQTQQRMTLLMTIFSNVKADSFDDDLCISIFIAFDRGIDNSPKQGLIERYSIQNKGQLDKLKNGYTKVVIHKKAEKPVELESEYILPKYYMESRKFTDQEKEQQAQLMDDAIMGLDGSTLLGIPFFEQEDVTPQPSAKYRFILQIDQWDLEKLSQVYKGVFNGGLGYFFMDKNFKRVSLNKEVGYFFVQS